MPPEKAQSLQDTFLNHVRKNKISLTIFLVNGVKLQGVVAVFVGAAALLFDEQTPGAVEAFFPIAIGHIDNFHALATRRRMHKPVLTQINANV